MKNRAAKMQFLPMVENAFLRFKADVTTFLKYLLLLIFPNILKRGCEMFQSRIQRHSLRIISISVSNNHFKIFL